MLIAIALLDPTIKLEKRPPSTKVEIILLNASMTITKRRGDKWSPCLRPCELLKKPDEVPFTKIEKGTKEIQ